MGLKYVVIAHPFGALTTALPNVAVAIALGNILFLEGWKRWLLYGIPLLQCLIVLVSIVLPLFMARPIEGLWNPTVPAHFLPGTVINGVWFAAAGMIHCYPTSRFRKSLADISRDTGISAFTGFYLGLLPIFALWTMKLALTKKIGVILLMGGTVLGGVAAAYRATKLKRNGLNNDFTCKSKGENG